MKQPHTFLVGIKGVAMTAMAVYLKEKGHHVSGSDLSESFPTDRILSDHAIYVTEGFDPGVIDNTIDEVVVTGAHGGMTNPQAKAALRDGIPTLMHGKYLGTCMKSSRSISVAGCHGKTTTAGCIASFLMSAGKDPSYAVGSASLIPIGNPGHFGKGEWFVAEADEYVTCPMTDATPRFLWQHPEIAVITNIDYDHPDVYPSFDAVIDAYVSFIGNVSPTGSLIMCGDDPGVQHVIQMIHRPVITYGLGEGHDYRAVNIQYASGSTSFTLQYKSTDIGTYTISLPGEHNVSNILAACIATHRCGISWEVLSSISSTFRGAKRRFEYIREYGGVIYIDDYAHHPKEIDATISAARSWYPDRRIVVLFQPHTYSRTKYMMNEFVDSLSKADISYITDIFPSARESYDPDISSARLVQYAEQQGHTHFFTENKSILIDQIAKTLRPGDLFFTMGAGDISTWQQEIFSQIM